MAIDSSAIVAQAAPTCVPSAPAVVGSARDRLVVTVPQCAGGAGATGYRLIVERSDPSGNALPQETFDVAAGVAQAEVTGLEAGTVIYRVRVAARNADGVGRASAPSAPVTLPFASMGGLVDRLYADFAGRAPSGAERADWVARLTDGRLSPVAAVDAAEQFAYWQAQPPAIRLYQAYFLRLPDLSGLNYWATQIRNRRSLFWISEYFARSNEFRLRYGTLSNAQFVDLIYQNILGRPGEPSGRSFWISELDSGRRTRGKAMVGFSESREYKGKTEGLVAAVDLFTGLLRRVPTESETTTWEQRPREEVATFLLGSSGFAARVRVIAPPWVTTASLPTATPGSAYPATTLTAQGGQGARNWSIASGSLPTGMSLSSAGVISGTSGAIGSSAFSVRVVDSAGRSTTRTLSITVAGLGVAAGHNHSCALLAGGTVKCWGDNEFGQLGNGTTTNSTTPVPVAGLAGVTHIAAGGNHTCAVLIDGTGKCWGADYQRLFGDGSPTKRLAPETVPGLTDATSIVAGQYHDCAIRSDSSVACWGDNWAGQLGDGTTRGRWVAWAVPGLVGATDITAELSHTCAVLLDGTAKCWGDNSFGQLGDGTTEPRLSPVPVAALTGATDIAAGDSHSCALIGGGAAACWGDNSAAQLGDGTLERRLTPVAVAGLPAATSITGGYGHTCALVAGSNIACWGANSSAELGDGTTDFRRTPTTVTGLASATSTDAHGSHTCARLTDASVWCWGFNFSGQLGDGSHTPRFTPVRVSGL
ncbi:DUF4214 domain-containing protein [Iamia sp. SCSIO 61187]|uniref:DUF4214 domain-containing protein n=1 Tax=Iamia sp. SCSIO 61187 TaxID=2722752 RepID=UPI001C62D9CF|nr:DUF4214 domain-containing protein [Iamia sp. SCSIO 61187]QYG93457.1 DUF4214 domain-containing protein [Iamia sp. SCSIO 61187]